MFNEFENHRIIEIDLHYILGILGNLTFFKIRK